MKVSHLIEQLQQLPPDKSALCQVIATDGKVWNMHFEFHDIPNSWMVQLAVSHPDLHTLPETEARK